MEVEHILFVVQILQIHPLKEKEEKKKMIMNG